MNKDLLYTPNYFTSTKRNSQPQFEVIEEQDQESKSIVNLGSQSHTILIVNKSLN